MKKPAGKKSPARKSPAAKGPPKKGKKPFARQFRVEKFPARAAAARKKGGPLRSKKQGKNQVAQARRLGPPRSLGPARNKALRPTAPADLVPAPPRVPEPASDRPDPGRARADLVARAGLDKKAEDVLVLDVRGLTSYADYFVLMTADSDRQAGAIADAVDEKLKAEGASKVGVEGYQSGRWILVDYGDVVAHVFNREARSFYDLEGLWADAPRFTVGG